MSASPDIARSVIVTALTALGIFPQQAATAAADSRIAWNEQALEACGAYVRRSLANEPAAALWSQYLSRGVLPPVLKVAAPPATDVPPCPVCGGPVDQSVRRASRLGGSVPRRAAGGVERDEG